MNIAKFSVKNSVLVNMMMIGLVAMGLLSLQRMPTELNPEINFNWVMIIVPYTGASPSETEALIVDPIESEVQDVDDIDEIQSTAGEGFGMVWVKFADMSDTKFRERLTDLKAEVDKVQLPEEAEDPQIDVFSSGDFMPVITVNMAYSIPQENAYLIADKIQEDIEDIPGVSKTQVSGLAEREIWVEMDPEKMNSYRITFDQVAMALRSRNLNVPGGTISFGKSEYFIRSVGEYSSLKEIEQTILRPSNKGDFVRIRDVAKVVDRREEMTILSRLNGENSITFSISKQSSANSIDVIDDVKALVETYREQVPDGIVFSFTNDNGVYIKQTINILRNNAILGMLMIIIVLFLFLGFGNAALAALGIPISFLITFLFMYLFGYTLNGNTLFALVMVLGIIVDDAIIILENSHRYRLKGYNAVQSAIKGTTEVIKPILASIGTNIAAFLPLILLPGIMGKFMRIIPLVFALALIASLFEAFILLPSHYADWTVKSRVYKKGEKKFFKKLRRFYTSSVVFAVRRRYILVPLLVLTLIISPFILYPILGVEMYGEADFDQVKVLVKLPEGSNLDETNRIMQKFEKVCSSLPREAMQDYVVNVGLLQGNEEWVTKKNVGQILIQLIPLDQRDITAQEIEEMMRERSAHISGPSSVEFELISNGPPVGKPISVKVEGKYLDDIKAASLALQDSIKQIDGTFDVSDNFPPGKKEIRIVVDEDKAALYGFSAQYVALNVRYAFDGIKATEYREGDEEIDVIVKYNQENRTSLDDVLYLKMTNNAGQTVSLRDMVGFVIEPGPNEIQRYDQKRTILVTGNIDEQKIKLDVVNKKLATFFSGIEENNPGVHLKIGGQFEEFMDVFQNIGILFLFSIILIFLILGVQFNSYSQPLIILTTVPFALLGAMVGLLISNNPFSIISLFGFVALAGLVVNDAIILIDFINNRRSGGETSVYQYWRSIINAGRLRLRPVILTSVTTISGLLPMAFGLGGSSEMWAPLANVILFGLLVATALTLMVIPMLVAILDDLKRNRKKARKLMEAQPKQAFY